MDTNIVEGSGTATGTDTYIVKLSVKVSELKISGLYVITFDNTNTGASTLNVNSLGDVTIKDDQNNALISGSIKANIPYQIYFNGTNFITMGNTGGIYNNSGSLVDNTIVTMEANSLQFDSTEVTGLLTIDAVNNGLGIGTPTINTESILELESTTKALRLTRMTTTQRTVMTGASGFIVLDTTLGFIFYHTGSAWVQL